MQLTTRHDFAELGTHIHFWLDTIYQTNKPAIPCAEEVVATSMLPFLDAVEKYISVI